MSSSLFRLTCQPNDCEMLRNILGAGPRCICCTGIVVYRCIRQQHNDNWFFPRSNGLSDHALTWRCSVQHFRTLDTFCPTLPYLETFCPTLFYLGDGLPNTALPWTLAYIGDVLSNTSLHWRRSAPHYLGYVLPNTALPLKRSVQHYIGDVLPHTTLETFCPTLPYLGKRSVRHCPNLRRTAQHCPTLDTFCPTLHYIGDVLHNTALHWKQYAQHCPTLDTFCPTLPSRGDVLPNTALPWRPSSSRIRTTSLTHEITHVDQQMKCHEQSATMMLAAN